MRKKNNIKRETPKESLSYKGLQISLSIDILESFTKHLNR